MEQSNFDTSQAFVRQAYEHKTVCQRYARATRCFIRRFTLTPTQVLARFDKFLSCRMFAGFEGRLVALALSLEPRMPILRSTWSIMTVRLIFWKMAEV